MELDKALNILGLEKASSRSHTSFSYKMPRRPLDPEFANQTLGELKAIILSPENIDSKALANYKELSEIWETVVIAINSDTASRPPESQSDYI